MFRTRGFTLIEILVVIAIIALLIGILFPALSSSKEHAKGVVCQNNLRQIGMGAYFYSEANNSFIPRGLGGGSGQAWFQLFMPYLSQKPVDDDYRNVEIFRCPAYPNKEQTVCYVVNGWNFRDRTDKTGSEITSPSLLLDCTRPTDTAYLADNEFGTWRSIIKKADDEGENRCDVWTESHLAYSTSEDFTRGRRVAQDRHGNGCNILYFDWHSEQMAAEKMTIELWRFKK